jgi:hypothetical protein
MGLDKPLLLIAVRCRGTAAPLSVMRLALSLGGVVKSKLRH